MNMDKKISIADLHDYSDSYFHAEKNAYPHNDFPLGQTGAEQLIVDKMTRETIRTSGQPIEVVGGEQAEALINESFDALDNLGQITDEWITLLFAKCGKRVEPTIESRHKPLLKQWADLVLTKNDSLSSRGRAMSLDLLDRLYWANARSENVSRIRNTVPAMVESGDVKDIETLIEIMGIDGELCKHLFVNILGVDDDKPVDHLVEKTKLLTAAIHYTSDKMDRDGFSNDRPDANRFVERFYKSLLNNPPSENDVSWKLELTSQMDALISIYHKHLNEIGPQTLDHVAIRPVFASVLFASKLGLVSDATLSNSHELFSTTWSKLYVTDERRRNEREHKSVLLEYVEAFNLNKDEYALLFN